MSSRFTRRIFMGRTAVAAAAISAAPAILRAQNVGDKLNVAVIGCGGKGASDSDGVAKTGQNIVALCDVDDNTLGKAAEKFNGAKTYNDFRKMLEMQKDIDAVTVSIPDHMHAPAAMMAIKLGKHVYVQKPLTHTIEEARKLTEAARKYKVATIMGNQGHSGEGWRVLCEYIWSGAIGDVTEVHCWTNRPIWPQGIERPQGQDDIPKNLHWDLWLGAAPERPFKSKHEVNGKQSDVYHPFAWRGWWDFGTGALGDMGCHIMDGPFWALKLGRPTKVELVASTELKKESAPKSAILRYHFPEREGMPPVTLTWHDGGMLPKRPMELEPGRKLAEGDNGSLYIGSKGKMMAGTYGGGVRIIPEEQHKNTPKPPQSIPRPKGHYEEWIEACKGGRPASGNFDYAGPFTEVVLLGNLALRTGQNVEWDGENMKVTNNPDANNFVRKEYRKGWEV
jgi:predicted dehydrogenase